MANIEDHTIYCDLLREFRNNGHSIYTISPYEKRIGKETEYKEINGVHMLHVKTGNATGNVGLIEKGIAQLLLEGCFISGIKNYFQSVKFDLIIYSTPPITFYKAIEYVKKRDGAKTYLLLKDIFPQNAIDLGMMRKTGLKAPLYKFFRNKEKKLYAISDYIGCMSQANVDYVIKHNPEVNPRKVEVCPNCVDPMDLSVDEETRVKIRGKYGIPIDKIVFVYGGNLGKPQGIDFLIKCLESQKNNEEAYFLIVGDGAEFGKLEAFVNSASQDNLKLMKRLPKEDYDAMVGACDVGMIFLDHRFTIPNFPSRLLAYMQAKIPVLAVTDPNTDIGKVITEGGFGWWCESNDVGAFTKNVEQIINRANDDVRNKEWSYLNENYSVNKGYEIIIRHIS